MVRTRSVSTSSSCRDIYIYILSTVIILLTYTFTYGGHGCVDPASDLYIQINEGGEGGRQE